MIQNTSKELGDSLRNGQLDAVFVATSCLDDSFWKFDLFSESYFALLPLDHKLKSLSKVRLE